MTNIILYSIIILISVLCLFIFYKYITLKNKTKKIIYELKKPIRVGYISYSLTYGKDTFKSLVYVNEIDRFTNGESKIEIKKIDPGSDTTIVSSEKVINYIKSKFLSIMKTSDIIWLDSEETIKTMRKDKLEKLKNIIK